MSLHCASTSSESEFVYVDDNCYDDYALESASDSQSDENTFEFELTNNNSLRDHEISLIATITNVMSNSAPIHKPSQLTLSQTVKHKETTESDDDSIAMENYNLLAALPQITSKFDVLFPFYRLSDKDCKKLSLYVYNEFDFIDKIFCISKGRKLEAIIYYYGSQTPKIVNFINNDDCDKEVLTWKDIIMNQKYCLNELGYKVNHGL